MKHALHRLKKKKKLAS